MDASISDGNGALLAERVDEPYRNLADHAHEIGAF
jgi:hypothetical protein